MRITWGTVYVTAAVAATALTGTGLIAASVNAHNTPLGIAGLAAFLVSFTVMRLGVEARTATGRRARFEADRERLTEERIQLAAERCVFTSDVERTRRELEAQERVNAERLAADRATMLAEVEVERERMHAALANAKAEIERKAVEVGFKLGRAERLDAANSHTRARVIALPLPEPQAVTMETGTLN